MKYDFGGYATRNDLTCSDGRVIKKDAFKAQNGQTVPLVWNHNHDDVNDVLGLAHLENRKDGVYAYCEFNDTDNGKTAKELVQHGDVRSLSIFANQLIQKGSDVIHGLIREVMVMLIEVRLSTKLEHHLMIISIFQMSLVLLLTHLLMRISKICDISYLWELSGKLRA